MAKINFIKRKRKPLFKIRGKFQTTLEAYFFMLPFIIGIVLFFIFPIGLSLQLAFGKLVSIIGLKIEFAGLANFIRAFVIDVAFIPMFLSVIKETIVRVPLTIIFSLIIAILVNKNIRFRGFFRTIFFLPFLLGTGYIMQQLLKQDVSGRAIQSAQSFFMPPEVLNYLGPMVSNFLNSFFSIIIVILWGAGAQILLFLSGLQGISPSYYEAAKVESANEWDCFWHITLPLMSPIMLLCIVYSLVDSFTNISNPVLQYTKTISFQYKQFDYASAVGWIYFLFILLTVWIAFMLMKRSMYSTEMRGGKIR